MMLNAKDFYIDYMHKVGKAPSEEEWLAYVDDMIEEAERNKEAWMDAFVERMEQDGDPAAPVKPS